MNNIFPESELTQQESVPWGQWIFSEPSKKLHNEPSVLNTQEYSSNWKNLLLLLRKVNNVPESNNNSQNSSILNEVTCEPMECSIVSDSEREKSTVVKCDSALDDLATNVVHICKDLGPKLNNFTIVQEETGRVTNELSKLSIEQVNFVMEKAWVQLISDSSKLCFCVLFRSDKQMMKVLCKNILLPWLCKSTPSKMEQLSEILSADGETVCSILIAPLLKVKDSPMVKDLLNLEEIMSCMTVKQWSTLCRDLLCGLGNLEIWQIPVLTMIVEHATPSSSDLCCLIQLMSSAGSQLSQNRDFGSLLVAVASSLPQESSSLISQLKLITNSYKGSLKFKVLKILADVK